jgi:CheY-like chemotaxis protein
LGDKPRILCICDAADASPAMPRRLTDNFDVVSVESPVKALSRLREEQFEGLYVLSPQLRESLRLARLLQNEQILESMPDGVALLGRDNSVIWANGQLARWCQKESIVGENFYSVLMSPEILGPDFCPFHTALTTGHASNSMLRSSDNRYYQVHAAPLLQECSPPEQLIVTVRDVTTEMLQQQKLEAIHKAGMELTDLTTAEIFNMPVEDRIELLKSNILHHTQDLLNFDVVEIRLLDQNTGKLEPLLSVGLDQEAECRELHALPQSNGVTGFVASTGKSYLCEDTAEDPLYLCGLAGAKSSLTVPLIWHDDVIGTFNVESPEPGAFTESDLQFLEIFSRDLAVALNTLELLAAQQANTAQASVEAIHSAVALPIDEILNDAVNVMEGYIGHEPAVVERLQRILLNARDIKQVIHKVGQTMTPMAAVPEAMRVEKRPKLSGKRILVVDVDEAVRTQAHALLERYGAVVETAHDGAEAVYMVRCLRHAGNYDAIISDIRLPNMTGYDLLINLKNVMDPVPMILMTGYGYDPGHSIVKARQAGLPKGAVLYKPFRLDQLLETVENIIDQHHLAVADMQSTLQS